MKQKKRILSLLLCAVMLVGLLPAAALADSTEADSGAYVAGTHTGTATGFSNETVTVDLTIGDNGTITEISAESSRTSATASGGSSYSYWQSALSVLDEIKTANGTDGVDAITGATYSSSAMISAAEEALSKAVNGFSGGTGTEADPYLISSEAGLRYLQGQVAAGTTYQGQYIKLTADIELTGEWTPIGSSSTLYFAGTFDGDGHTISGLEIGTEDAPSTQQYAGLFGYVYSGATILNLSLDDVSIYTEPSAAAYAGAIVAFMKVDSSGSTISVINNCHVSGSISVDTQESAIAMVGGIAGFGNQYMTLANCSADVNISVSTGSKNANAGGLVGFTSANCLIANSASYGTVYSDSSNSGSNNAGGLVGGLTGMMYNCFTSVAVTAAQSQTKVGAIAGNLAAASLAYECYYDSSKTTADIGNNGSSASGSCVVVAKDESEVRTEEFVAILSENLNPTKLDSADALIDSLSSSLNGCDFAARADAVNGEFYDWTLENGTVVLADTLWASSEVDTTIFESGSGTKADPYVIETEVQFRAFATSLTSNLDYSGIYITLGDDINVSSEVWTPIGGSDYAFNGTFDGAGYTISGLTIGAASDPLALNSENIYIGLFGVLGANAVVQNVNLTNVAIYTSYSATAYIGGIAGVTEGSSSDYTGALIDSCSVTGVISHTATKGNNFTGGLVGMQIKGSIINSWADVDVSCVVQEGDYIAEAGGLVGLNNRGLVANCYSLGDIYGSASRNNGDEGMASISSLVGVQAGALVGCYASGDNTTGEYSTYVGMVSGWVTGIGKSYSCWYDLDVTMTVDGENVDPVESIGTKVTSGVDDEGSAYTGGLVDNMNGYTALTYASVAESLNSYFSAYPIDIVELYGLSASALKTWVYDENSGLVTFGSSYETVTYEKPECETVTQADADLQDGTWYGRSEDESTIIMITVSEGEITDIEVLLGESSGDGYDEALATAEQKSEYGDFSHYFAADASQFDGGSGTENDPYQISSEAQLRYLAYSINEDVDWSSVYFVQTADIDVSSAEWLPIGWALNAEVNGSKTTVAAYPFRGNYDGAGYTISGLWIGSESDPADQMTSGLFGMVAGSYTSNETPTGDERVVNLENIRLEDVAIYVSTRYETYTGGLLGNGQNGVYIDNCSVTGTIEAETSESFCRVGGLAGNVLRGSVTNCWTDVEINAVTDASYVYAGGLFSIANRVTVINCYALGDLTGSSTSSNKVYLGGLTGQSGAVQINCYAAGDVVSKTATVNVGGLNGRTAGIAADYNCYYNSEAVQAHGNTINTENVGAGAVVTTFDEDIEGKTAAELASAAFAKELNENIENLSTAMETVNAFLNGTVSGNGYAHANYYRGNELLTWTLIDGVVTFGTETENEDDDDDEDDDEDDVQYLVDPQVMTEVPESLADTYDTVEDIEIALRAEISSTVDEVVLYDVTIQMKTGDGEWVDVTEDYFLTHESLTFTLPYPSGTDSTYTFTVVHMFTSEVNGHEIGETEICTVRNTADGLEITVTGLSPILVAWQKATASTRYEYEEIAYRIAVDDVENGTVEVSDTRAYEGDRVTITVEPDDGYELDSLTVTDIYGDEVTLKDKGDGVYTFTMPDSRVTITATFVKIVEEETEVYGTLIKQDPTTPFTDIANNRFKSAIANVYAAGLMNGVSETTFDPEGTLTRAMVVTTLYRLAGEPAITSTSGFSDVGTGLWYSDAVAWATENGVVNGYTDGTFKPEQAVTREELATIFYRYASANGIYVGNTFALDGFTDHEEVQSYAVTAMEWAVANSVLVSRTTAMLNPGEAATRAEVAQALYTLIK